MNKRTTKIHSTRIVKPVTEEDIRFIIDGLGHVTNLLKEMSTGNLTHRIGNISFLISCYNRKVKQLSEDLSSLLVSTLKCLSTITTGNVSHKKSQIQTILIYVKSELEERRDK